MRERAALYDWKCVQRKPSHSMHILIYIVKFAEETTSIQLLDDEDGVTQSSNEMIYIERDLQQCKWMAVAIEKGVV